MPAKKDWQLTPYGRWLKIKLAEHGIRQTQLAEMIGVSPQRITDIMYGVQPVTKYRLAIEEALGEKTPEELKLDNAS